MASTPAGNQLTLAHREAQSQIADDVLKVVHAAWPLMSPTKVDETVDTWMNVIVPLIVNGRQKSIETAAAYLVALAQLETGTAVTPVRPSIDDDVQSAVRTSLRVTGPITIKTLTAQGMSPVAAASQSAVKVLGATKRHVMNGGRDTIYRTSEQLPTVTGYARVTDGKPCFFCAMLASRGAVYRSAESAGEVIKYHDGCGCTVEPVFADTDWTNPNGKRAAELETLWVESTRGLSGTEARNAFRRAYESTLQ